MRIYRTVRIAILGFVLLVLAALFWPLPGTDRSYAPSVCTAVCGVLTLVLVGWQVRLILRDAEGGPPEPE